jgi:hypothetical protein
LNLLENCNKKRIIPFNFLASSLILIQSQFEKINFITVESRQANIKSISMQFVRLFIAPNHCFLLIFLFIGLKFISPEKQIHQPTDIDFSRIF